MLGLKLNHVSKRGYCCFGIPPTSAWGPIRSIVSLYLGFLWTFQWPCAYNIFYKHCYFILIKTHLGLTLFSGSPPGALREIEGFATHICVTREMGAVFHDAYMRHQAEMVLGIQNINHPQRTEVAGWLITDYALHKNPFKWNSLVTLIRAYALINLKSISHYIFPCLQHIVGCVQFMETWNATM